MAGMQLPAALEKFTSWCRCNRAGLESNGRGQTRKQRVSWLRSFLDVVGRHRPEQMPVFQRPALLPGLVSVGKVDSLARRWMAGPPQFIHQPGSWDSKVFDLQLYLSRRGGVVVARDFQSKPVGLVFLVARIREDEWTQREIADAKKEQDQRPGSDVRNAIQTEKVAEAINQPSAGAKQKVEHKE